jgi:DNA-binding NarL/FixJ family response regulator
MAGGGPRKAQATGSPDQGFTLLLADSQPVFAWGLARLLEAEAPQFRVVGIATSHPQLDEMVHHSFPDLALVDAAFGIESARRIQLASPQTKVVTLTCGEEAIDLPEALKAGVGGYVLRQSELREVIEALDLVLSGQLVVPLSLASRTLRSARSAAFPLTDMERQILARLVEGETNREIAARLYVSERTVRRRLLAIYSKLGVADRIEAALYAVRSGVLGSEKPE